MCTHLTTKEYHGVSDIEGWGAGVGMGRHTSEQLLGVHILKAVHTIVQNRGPKSNSIEAQLIRATQRQTDDNRNEGQVDRESRTLVGQDTRKDLPYNVPRIANSNWSSMAP